DAKTLIARYNAGKAPDAPEKDLWQAKKVVESTVHPDTGEPVFLPFRMSCFVPTNLVVVAGMLMPNPSIKTIVFWQWMNQSVNVAINYANANKTIVMSPKEIATAYFGAVTTSVLIAVGLTQSVPRIKSLSAGTKSLLMKLAPFTAVAAAGTVNVFLMRGKEVLNGIDVYDKEGNSYGKSKTAGFNAVSQVAISRILANAPVMIIPPLILARLQKTRFLQQHPKWTIPVNLGLIGTSMITTLPLAIAVFPQRAEISVDKLEPEFQNLKDKQGHLLTSLLYNKGL
ncbi:hypothetical protein BZG36_03917, partial [Bifiguratus adelaidae]